MKNNRVVVFTDGVFWAKSRNGAAAIVVWNDGEERIVTVVRSSLFV